MGFPKKGEVSLPKGKRARERAEICYIRVSLVPNILYGVGNLGGGVLEIFHFKGLTANCLRKSTFNFVRGHRRMQLEAPIFFL